MTKYLKLKSLYPVRYYIFGLAVITIIFSSLYLYPIRANADTTIPLCEITRSLKIGSSGEDVRCLQRYLNWAGYTISATGFGSPGNESMYFGPLTANAVIKWQNSNANQVLIPAGLTVGTGYFGPLSFNWYVNIVKGQLGVSQ